MRLLLDTHVVVWWLAGSRALGKQALALIISPDAELNISAASWWEIGIKRALGRMQFDWSVGRALMVKNRITVIPVTLDHAEAASALPPHHGDPFDRMLVAQAAHEGMKLLTRDKHLKAYGPAVHCV